MHLLYLDDSGSVQNASDKHVVLAGLSVFERVPYWFSQSLDRIAQEVWPESPNAIEFRGVDILSGRKHWRGIGRERRQRAYRDALGLLSGSRQVVLFAAAIHKAAISPDDPMEYAFEQIANRFDRYLGRLHHAGNTQRGLMILDDSSYQTSIQGLARDFRTDGHRWGQLRNLADVPLFVDSKATRMIQYADLVAHGVRRYYERDDPTYLDIIYPRFDHSGGVLHGLVHYTPFNTVCNCHICRQKDLS